MNYNVINNWKIGDIIETKSLNQKATFIETEGDNYVLKLKKDITQSANIDSLKVEHELIKRLLEEGLSVPCPVKTIQGSDYVELNNELYCLYTHIEGHHVENHYAVEHLAELASMYGHSISKLHKGLLAITDGVDSSQTHFLHNVNAWALPILNEHNYIDEDLIQVIDYMTQYELIYETLPVQLIHRDLHPSNFVVRDGIVSGFLDFEISVKGIRLFDLCYTCTALLGEAVEGVFNNDKTKINQWKTFVSHLIKGYYMNTELSDEELDCIPLVMILIQFIMSAYFLSIDESDLTHQNLDSLKWVYEHRKELLDAIYAEIE